MGVTWSYIFNLSSVSCLSIIPEQKNISKMFETIGNSCRAKNILLKNDTNNSLFGKMFVSVPRNFLEIYLSRFYISVNHLPELVSEEFPNLPIEGARGFWASLDGWKDLGYWPLLNILFTMYVFFSFPHVKRYKVER